MLFHYGDDLDGRGMLADRLCDWWVPDDAARIAEAFCTYAERLDDPTRRMNSDVPDDYISDLIAPGQRR